MGDHRRRPRHHLGLGHPGRHGHRLRQRPELGRVAPVADRHQYGEREVGERLHGAPVDAGEVLGGRRLGAEGDVDELGPAGRERVGAEAVHAGLIAAGRAREQRPVEQPLGRDVERAGRQVLERAAAVDARVEVDADPDLRHAEPVGRHRRGELHRLAHDHVRPPLLDGREHARAAPRGRAGRRTGRGPRARPTPTGSRPARRPRRARPAAPRRRAEREPGARSEHRRGLRPATSTSWPAQAQAWAKGASGPKWPAPRVVANRTRTPCRTAPGAAVFR